MSKKTTTAELIRSMITDSYHHAAPVEEEPVTILTEWSVRRVVANFDGKGDSIHFVGWAGYEGRVCSPLQNYDRTRMFATSRSGRVYQLEGLPGHNADAEWVWGLWIRQNGNPRWEDITNDHVKRTVHQHRKGWDEQFKIMAERGDDALIDDDPDLENGWEKEE